MFPEYAQVDELIDPKSLSFDLELLEKNIYNYLLPQPKTVPQEDAVKPEAAGDKPSDVDDSAHVEDGDVPSDMPAEVAGANQKADDNQGVSGKAGGVDPGVQETKGSSAAGDAENAKPTADENKESSDVPPTNQPVQSDEPESTKSPQGKKGKGLNHLWKGISRYKEINLAQKIQQRNPKRHRQSLLQKWIHQTIQI